MTSVYGTTDTKLIETGTSIKDSRDDFEKYILCICNCIDIVLEVNGRCYIKTIKSVMYHFNYVHCGVEVLSMSKRSMDKVSDVSDDCGAKTYYQDTY